MLVEITDLCEGVSGERGDGEGGGGRRDGRRHGVMVWTDTCANVRRAAQLRDARFEGVDAQRADFTYVMGGAGGSIGCRDGVGEGKIPGDGDEGVDESKGGERTGEQRREDERRR